MLSRKKIAGIVTFIALCFGFILIAGGRGELLLYVVFSDTYNDEIISEQQIEDGKDAVVPEDPYHRNYVFAGWYLVGEDDIRVTDFTNITTDLKVEARYKGDINNNGIADEVDEYYNVIFYDGITNEELKNQVVLVGMDATAPTARTHEGYKFIGWDKAYSGVTTNLNINSIYESTRTISEIDDPEPIITTYTLNFFDRYNNVFDTQEVKGGAAGSEIRNVPVYSGLTLNGWYDQMNGLGQEYVVGNLINKDMSIYGYWTKSKYSVIINPNGGTLVNAQTRNTIEHESDFTLPNAIKSYRLIYNLDGGSLETESNVIDVDAELLGYCVNKTTCTTEEMIKPNTVVNINSNVTYNAIWGNSINEVELLSASKASSASTNFNFIGWAVQAHGDAVHIVPKNISINSDTELYAVYASETRKYEYKIILNKGSFENSTFVNSSELYYGSNAVLPNLLRKYEVIYNIGDDEVLESDNNKVYIDANLIGYCKNKETCTADELIPSNSEITIDGKSEYYAIWGESKEKLNIYTCAKANSESVKYVLKGWATEESGEAVYTVPGSEYITDDLNLYSKYNETVRQYDISFDFAGGTLIGEVNYKDLDYGSKYTLPAASRDYKLTLDSNGGALQSGQNTINTAASLIGYCYNANTCADNKMIKVGAEVIVGSNDKYVAQWGNALSEISLPSAAKANDSVGSYEFTGWSKTLNGKVSNTASILLTGDTTLFAAYDITYNKHTISFDTAGGVLPQGTPSSIEYDHGVLAPLPTPTRNYVLTYDPDGGTVVGDLKVYAVASFQGWCEDKTSCEQPLIGKATINKDATYYAVWGPAKEPIKLALATKTSESQTFKLNYWRPNNQLPYKAGTNLTLKSDITLKAYWTAAPRKYTVSFVSAFGTIPENQIIAYNTGITYPGDLVSEGKVFYGWYTSLDATKKWDFDNDIITGDTILYGIWDVTSYSISYKTNGGILSEDNSGPYESGTEINLPNVTKSYTLKYILNGGLLDETTTYVKISFKGWCKNSTTCEDDMLIPAGSKQTVDGNNVYNAIWEAESNEVTLPTPSKVSTNTEQFTFDNWTNSSNTYPGGTKIKLTEDLTLEAHYLTSERKYVVNFETEYGVKPNSQLVSFNGTIDSPGILEDDMHTFIGWFKDSTKTTQWNFATDKITSDTIIYASWSE